MHQAHQLLASLGFTRVFAFRSCRKLKLNQFSNFSIYFLFMIQTRDQQKINAATPKQDQSTIFKKYTAITYEQRVKLIELVQTLGFSIYKASQMLGIKKSTAKAIVRQFRTQGRIFRRKSERKSRQPHPNNGNAVQEKSEEQRSQLQEDGRQEEKNTAAAQLWLPLFGIPSYQFYSFSMMYASSPFY